MASENNEQSVKAWIHAEREAVVAEAAAAGIANPIEVGPTKLKEAARTLRAHADSLFRAISRNERSP
jgi:ApbE superfamily uncharacterized protein (UPF0280 family)